MQAGTYGITLPLQTDIDLSNTTTMVIKITMPSGTTPASVTHVLTAASSPPLTIPPPASQGIINYLVQAGDFPIDGLYEIQLTDTTTGRAVPMSVVELYVYPNT